MTRVPSTALVDETQFVELTEPHRRDLLVHCYRFTGSVHDAEDLVQETLARAWRGRHGYRGEAGPRTWLRRIATRACLDALRKQPRRRSLPSLRGSPGADDVLWLEPLPDDLLGDTDADPAARYAVRESVTLAFVAALQTLPPRQRAVLILRDVLAMRAAEVADLLEMSVSAVNSTLHRARRAVESVRQSRALDTLPAGDPAEEELVRRYVEAWEAGDVDLLVSTLKSDATLEMPPIPESYAGLIGIRSFLTPLLVGAGHWRGALTRANGGPAIALYERSDGEYRFTGIQLLQADPDGIRSIVAYMDGALAQRFHLPERLWTRLG